MKRFLGYMVWAAVLLLLVVCPVKVFAAENPLPDRTALGSPSNGGKASTTFQIGEIEKWRYLTVTVLDGETHLPLRGITVQISPITPTANPDEAEASLVTGPDGRVRFRRSKNQQMWYKLTIEHEGFQRYTTVAGEEIGLPDKENEETVSLEPVYFTVRYHASWPGSIPPGEETESVRWGTPPRKAPTQMVEPGQHYVFSCWILNGNKVDISQLKLKQDIDLYAQFSRQYLVRYEAGKYGYLDGPLEEYVTDGETPKAVPAPVPMNTKDYWFVKWRMGWDSRSIDPAAVVIRGDTTFKAVFDVRKPQPVIIKTPPNQQGTAALEPSLAPALPGEESQGGGAGEEIHKDGSHGSRGAGQALPSLSQSQGQDQGQSLGQGETSSAVQSSGEEPEYPGNQSAVPSSGQVSPNTHASSITWLILLCCLITLIAGLWRILAIGRLLKHPQDEEERANPRGASLKAVVTEVVLGLICVVLWAIFRITSTLPADLWALALWAVILVVMALLLARSEYRLRK